MASLNRATIIGHLGKDPETRRLGSGDPVVSFSVATSDRWTDKGSGEKKERTEWHRITVFNTQLCDVAERYLRKGSQVLVEGRIETRKWQDQGGQERYSTEIVLRQFDSRLILLDRAERQTPSPDSYGTTRPAQSYGAAKNGAPAGGTAQSGGYANDLDDDIPF